MRVLRVVSALLASIGLLATGVTAAHADDPPLPIPGSPVCELVSTTLADHYLDFIGFLIPQIIQNKNDTVVVQKTTAAFSASASATVSASVGLNSDEVKAETGITVQASVTVSASQETDVTVNPYATVYAQYGAFMLTLVYHRTFSPPGCNEPFSFLPGWETTDYKSAPTGLGWRVWAYGTTALETPLPGGGNSVDPPSSPQPQPVTSVYGLPDGTLLATTDTHRMYKMVGGAPVWLSTCAGGLCEPYSHPTTQAVIDAGPAVPADGATAIDQEGLVFKFVGGAPIHLSTCAVGCGTPVSLSTWSIAARDHMNEAPADGSTLIDEQGDVFKFVGGAPIHLSTCAVGCGSPVHISTWSVATLDHMRPYPADGSTLIDEQGDIFKFVGGAPIHLSTCDGVGCGNPVHISTWSVATLEHMLPHPADGSTLIDQQGDVFKFVGGAPIHLSTCDGVGCGNPVHISTWSVATLEHMLPAPQDGSTAIDQQGDIFKFAGGAPIHLSSCSVGCGNPVPISTWSIASYDHMNFWPADNTTIRTETGAVYKFAGGAPFYLSDCSPGCGINTAITQWSVDVREHMAHVPSDGTSLVAVESGTHYQVFNGEADLADPCSNSVNCATAVTVNQSSIDPIAQSTANRGPGFGELARYWNGSDHFSAVGDVPAGYRFEGPLGVLERTAVAGTTPLQACMLGPDEFTSLDPNCEGQTVIGTLGFLYTSPPAGQPSLPLYRCLVTKNNEHFDSNDPACEGQTVEHLLGYTLAYATFTRYSSGAEHWSSTNGVPPGYQPEWALGMVPMTPQPGTQPLMSCQMGVDEFTSLDPNCEGQTKIAQIGYIWSAPPPGLPTVPIYRCTVTATGGHFDSFDQNCEGQHAEARLGYLLARTQLSRTVENGSHRSTSGGGLPAGFRLEGAFGYLSWIPEPGTQMLMSCQYSGGEFDSLDPNCEGNHVNGPLGYIWQQPPTGASSAEIFRCVTPTGDHFDSTDPNCEGQHTEGPLGYVSATL